MLTRPFYLIIDSLSSPPRASRVTARWPALDHGEVAVRLKLEVNLEQDITIIEVTDPQAIVMATHGVAVEIPEDEEE